MRTVYPLLFCLTALAGPAQNDSTIHVNTHLVEVDVVVRDSAGPVRGLRKNDFTILDKGKPQTIATFGVRSTIHSTSNPSSKAASQPSGAVSNRLNSNGEEAGGATVVLWDMMNTDTADQAYVRSQVLKYLQTLTEREPVALYALVKQLRVIQDFTDDPGRLVRAVAGLGPQQSVNLTAPDLTDLASQINNPILSNWMGSGQPPPEVIQAKQAMIDLQTMAQNTASEMTDYGLRDRAFVTSNTLAAIAWHLAGLPGRKKLVWISGSFPGLTIDQRYRVGKMNGTTGKDSSGPQNSAVDTQDFGMLIGSSVRKLNEANVAVYPIAPRGLTTTMPVQHPITYGPDQPASLTDGSGLGDPSVDTMLSFANGTGGKAIYATNDLVTAMKTVMEDDEVTYTVGFYPSDRKQDGSYHALAVKVDKKGVDVRHRDGYYASDEKVTNAGNRRESINAVFGNPLDATQIGLKGVATPLPNRPGVYRLDIAVNTSELRLEHVKDRWLASVDFATMLSPSDSTKGTLETLQLSFTDNRLRAALANGFVFTREIVAGDRKGELRVVVQDRVTGMAGSVRVPITKN